MIIKQEYQNRKESQPLVDIRGIKLDRGLEQPERTRSVLLRIKNLYYFKFKEE